MHLVLYHFTVLHEHYAKTLLGHVVVNLEPFSFLWNYEHRSCGQSSLKLLETLLTSFGLNELMVLAGQYYKRSS